MYFFQHLIFVMIRVTLADQTAYDAKVVGFDQDKDVAVLQIDAPKDKLRPIPVGVSADLLVGQKVYAIGNPVSICFPQDSSQNTSSVQAVVLYLTTFFLFFSSVWT